MKRNSSLSVSLTVVLIPLFFLQSLQAAEIPLGISMPNSPAVAPTVVPEAPAPGGGAGSIPQDPTAQFLEGSALSGSSQDDQSSLLSRGKVQSIIRLAASELAREGVNIKTLVWEQIETPAGIVAVRGKQARIYPESEYLFIHAGNGQRLLRYDSDLFSPTIQIHFEDTGKAILILRGSIYEDGFGHLIQGTLQVYALNGKQTLLHTALVEQSGTTIEDVNGPELIIRSYTEYEEGRMGLHEVLKVTSGKVEVLSSNDRYVPIAVLKRWPTTLSNSNFVYGVSKHSPRGEWDSYEVFNKQTGAYVVSFQKHTVPIQSTGEFLEATSPPDVSADGKYAAYTYWTLYCTLAGCGSRQQYAVIYNTAKKTTAGVLLRAYEKARVVKSRFVMVGGKLKVAVYYAQGGIDYIDP